MARVPDETSAAVYEGYADSRMRVVHLPGGARPRISDEPGLARRLSSAGGLARVASLEWVLFSAALAVYALTRLWAPDRYPIYFFADEAVNLTTVLRWLDSRNKADEDLSARTENRDRLVLIDPPRLRELVVAITW